MSPMDPAWESVHAVLGEAVGRKVFPGAALLVARGDEILHQAYVGALEPDGRSVDADTIYDLSSLTKPLATEAALLLLAAEGRVALEQPLAAIYPEFIDAGPADERSLRETVTIEDVLGHRGGLRAVGGFWQRLQVEQSEQVGTRRAGESVASYAVECPLEYAPRSRSLYSDLGFIMLGVAIERLATIPLDEFVRERLYDPLAAKVSFRPIEENPAEDVTAAVAPCGYCEWRGGRVQATVQDENASAVGGVAGHAGLFGSALGVHSVVAEFVRASAGHGGRLDSDLVNRCWALGSGTPPGSTWVLGWDTPSVGASSAGSLISPGSVGHLGFTGTSVWIDRTRGVHVILLTNRLHPDRENIAIRQLRPQLHDAVFGAIDGADQATAST